MSPSKGNKKDVLTSTDFEKTVSEIVAEIEPVKTKEKPSAKTKSPSNEKSAKEQNEKKALKPKKEKEANKNP